MININDTLQTAIAGVTSTLNALAVKLGTSVESVWPKYVQLVQIEAAMYLGVLVAFYAAMYFVGRGILKQEFDYDYNKKCAQIAVPAVGWLCAVISSLAWPSLFTAILAPEATAFLRLLAMVQ